ncbi:hypothetical protein ACLOJK_041623 [Asimina triloba]
MQLLFKRKPVASAGDGTPILYTNNCEHTEKRNDQNGKTDGIAERKGQLVQEEEREKGRVGLSVYWIYVTTAYAGALVPFILLAQVLFQLLQIGSNYWMAWAAPVSKDAKAPVEGLVLILELIEEIAMLALEETYLEQLLLSLYRRASDQQIASSSPSNIDERSRSTLKSKARLFQEAKRLDIKPRRESPAVRSGRMFSPHAPINVGI